MFVESEVLQLSSILETMEKSWLRLNCIGADKNIAFGISGMIGAKHSEIKYINSPICSHLL
jgi:hypothetical protein